MSWTLGLATAEARQGKCTETGVTGNGDYASEPASCASGLQCTGPHTPGLQGQVSHCTKAGVTDRRNLVTGLVDWPCQTRKP